MPVGFGGEIRKQKRENEGNLKKRKKEEDKEKTEDKMLNKCKKSKNKGRKVREYLHIMGGARFMERTEGKYGCWKE